MTPDNHGWDDDEETIINFAPMARPQPSPAGDPAPPSVSGSTGPGASTDPHGPQNGSESGTEVDPPLPGWQTPPPSDYYRVPQSPYKAADSGASGASHPALGGQDPYLSMADVQQPFPFASDIGPAPTVPPLPSMPPLPEPATVSASAVTQPPAVPLPEIGPIPSAASVDDLPGFGPPVQKTIPQQAVVHHTTSDPPTAAPQMGAAPISEQAATVYPLQTNTTPEPAAAPPQEKLLWWQTPAFPRTRPAAPPEPPPIDLAPIDPPNLSLDSPPPPQPFEAPRENPPVIAEDPIVDEHDSVRDTSSDIPSAPGWGAVSVSPPDEVLETNTSAAPSAAPSAKGDQHLQEDKKPPMDWLEQYTPPDTAIFQPEPVNDYVNPVSDAAPAMPDAAAAGPVLAPFESPADLPTPVVDAAAPHAVPEAPGEPVAPEPPSEIPIATGRRYRGPRSQAPAQSAIDPPTIMDVPIALRQELEIMHPEATTAPAPTEHEPAAEPEGFFAPGPVEPVVSDQPQEISPVKPMSLEQPIPEASAAVDELGTGTDIDASAGLEAEPVGDNTETYTSERPAPAVAELAWLAVIASPSAHENQIFRLDATRMEMGRAFDAPIFIDDKTVSSRHAAVRYERVNDVLEFVLYDLASTNGSLVNGALIHTIVLRDNDRIKLGETELVFKKVGDPLPPAQ